MLCLTAFFSQSSWARLSLDANFGSAHNITNQVTVRQAGQPDIVWGGDFGTRPFEAPLYYNARIGWWFDDKNLGELEMVHHKLYAVNPPNGVSRFNITHGYNLIYFNYVRKIDYDLLVRLGLGMVITHDENTVRGLTLEEESGGTFGGGYSVSGPAMQVSLGRRFDIAAGFFFNIEAKMTMAHANIRVVNGDADVPNIAFHGLLGFGWAMGE